MQAALQHRGPDEDGIFSDNRVNLGHTRLSIIDIAGGQQPFQSADGSIVVAFNGEIYNHEELRNDLEKRGHKFRTRCDTESILHAYIEYQEACPEHLNGMFAFVVYDRTRNLLFGARDRFGKKPFFYARPRGADGTQFVFASEIRALLQHPAVRRDATVSREGVVSYLLRDYMPGEHTVYEGIHKLLPGHALRVSLEGAADQSPEFWRYWTNPIVAEQAAVVSEAEATSGIDARLDAAVQRRLMSDVPLGVFLSGGIDSTAILAYMSRHVPASDIHTFSIGFDEASFDESAFAQEAAKYYGTHHETRIFRAHDAIEEIDRCLDHMDEPLADPSLIPTSLLSRFAREQVTVALGGDGGDEVFAGYDPFKAIRAAGIYDRLVPEWLSGQAAAAARRLPNSDKNMSLAFRAERFLRGAGIPEEERVATWMGSFDPSGVAKLLDSADTAQIREQHFAAEHALLGPMRQRGDDAIRLGLAWYQNFYLVDDILVKADRASMMHSLELRSPFLDPALVEYVNLLPTDLKYKRGETKYVLKRLLSRKDKGRAMVPDSILYRKKKGFGMPVARWIRNELQATFRRALVDEWPQSLSFLNVRQNQALLDSHLSRHGDHWKELWSLFVLSEWARRWAT